MESTDFDVLVIGGGPGGSCAAAFARLRGMSVCLAEKEEFPRFHIGESLLPMGNAVLKATGAWPKIEAAGFVRKLGAEFVLADGPEEKEIVFSEGYVAGLDSAFQVERARFDAILLDHARSLGADVRTGTTVRALTEHRDHVTAHLSKAGGTRASVSARWAIDAGGRENLFVWAEKRELEGPAFPRKAAVYSHFSGVRRAPGPRGGNIVIVRILDGWFWIIPIGDDRTSVGLVTPLAALRGGPDPQALFLATVGRTARLRLLMEAARPLEPFRVASDYSYVRKRFASRRVLLAGDAAAFYDPIFSSGVYLSTHSARVAIEAVARAGERKRALTLLERWRYTRGLKAHCAVFRRLIEVFYDNDSFAVFMTQKPPLDLNRGLTSIVAGHARLTWPLWWRFKVFLMVCRIQRLIPLVKRIDHTVRVSPRPA